MFALLDSLSLPGDAAKPNDDAFGHGEDAAVVLDGATSLGEPLLPGGSDAAWIAHFGARRLMAHLAQGDAPQDALRHALTDAEKSFAGLQRRAPKERWEIPTASMMFATHTPDGFAAYWFGDCAALVARPGASAEIVGEAFARRAAESRRVAGLAKKKNLSPAAGIDRREYLTALRAARSRVNSGRNWFFSPDPQAAEHVHSENRAAPPGTLILLASDGFLAAASDYGLYSAQGLLDAARDQGLAQIGAQIRRCEEDDALGQRFPRFKKSDDATALLLRVV
jgi:hypothetical protein